MLVNALTTNPSAGSFAIVIEPLLLPCVKKNMFVPRHLVSLTGGNWVVNCTSESVILPESMCLALFEKECAICIAALSDCAKSGLADFSVTESGYLKIISKSLPSQK